MLSALLAYSWFGGSSPEAPASAQSHRTPRGGMQVHVDAKAAGISLDELVEKLLAAKTVEQVQELAKTLGTVGDDKSIDAVDSLVADTRDGVPAAIVGAFGAIGSDHAVEVLREHTHDARNDVRGAVIEALGTTHNPKAEPAIIEVARDPDTNVANWGISALGELGTDNSVAVLEDIAAAGVEETSSSAIVAIARVDSPASHDAISRLIDSPSLDVARHALASVTVVDDVMLVKINAIVKSGETGLLDVALDALSHAGTAAVPTLIAIAKNGAPTTRVAAVSALSRIENPDAMQALRELLDDDDITIVRSVIAALSTMTTDEARDLIISSALSDRDDVARRAIEALLEMHGPEVDQALVEVAKAHPNEHKDLLRHLVTAGNTEGVALTLQLGHSSEQSDRLMAIEIFAGAGTNDALLHALELVRNEHGDGKAAALRMLASTQPGEPAVFELLRDTVRGGTSDEAVAALGVLSKAGSEDARELIVSALTNSSADVVGAAVTALASFRMTPEAANALRSAAESHPELASGVMRQLFTVNSPVAVQIADRLLRSGDRSDAEQALRALEQAGTPEAAELLVRTARTADPETKASAIRSLASSGDKRAADVIIAALHDNNAQVREQAIYSLGSVRTDKARDALIDFSRTNDASDRRTALLALRDYGDARSQQRIIDLTRDPDASVRYYAIDYTPDTAAGATALKSILNDKGYDTSTRWRAANSLRYRGQMDDHTAQMIQALDAEYGYGYDY
ncbi:MAG TPA: HEAT repeat domain-containing protein [Kofleriaceae bacterium]|nr:HEAT repeat domain-containing protein [Kofleriaceae bacterium]